MTNSLSRYEYEYLKIKDPTSLFNYAKKLEGHTFREVLELGILPEGVARDDSSYDSASFKGGLGNLLEERYFGYLANSESQADFADAGVELKTTCYDTKADGSVKAGERLVLGMIAYDESIEAAFEDSHMWKKSETILLVYYGRDKSIDKYDQKISYVTLFTPPEADLAVIREDYKVIQDYVTAGRAEELSESLTRYLGACTKGSTAEKSLRDQAVYAPGKKAKSRAWCYKVSYMNCVLNDYIIGDKGGESIIKDPSVLKGKTFEEYVLSLFEPYVGMTDKEICAELGIPIPRGKNIWMTITYHMLGIKEEHAEEFEKANISAHAVRVNDRGMPKEPMSLLGFSFVSLAREEWESAPLRLHLEETRFFFAVFQEDGGVRRFKGARFWSMPLSDLEGPVRECWELARTRALTGVELTKKIDSKGGYTINNNLPKASENAVAHVRPRAGKSAYKLLDGTVLGNIKRDGDLLPDGQWMSKQAFWLNKKYLREIVRNLC